MPLDGVTLTKRTFTGIGYFHVFRDDKTGEIVTEECTQEEYERLGQPGGSQFNPTRKDCTWLHSAGGVLKVDTPTGMLGDKEYLIYEGKAFVTYKDVDMKMKGISLPETEIVADKIVKP